jgi:hypothetical protein
MNKFDINAPIENQCTRNGKKVLRIFDSQLPIDFPLSVFIEGEKNATQMTRDGRFYFSFSSHDHDLQTITPDVVSYHTFYKNDAGYFVSGGDYLNLPAAIKGKNFTCRLITELTVNPDTLESSCKTVWKKTDN